MMIKFESEGAAPFEMLEDHALSLVSLMGEGQRSQGALSGEALKIALEKLQKGLTSKSSSAGNEDQQKNGWNDEEDNESITLSTHAFPLRQMLQHAVKNDTYVMWRPK
jgi:5-methylcytosine-specific restriction endonuclease McrBC GTP-binding regulatory subunit McrB